MGLHSAERRREQGATVATLGGGSASELVFAVVKILAKTATSGGSSYQAGWVGLLKEVFKRS